MGKAGTIPQEVVGGSVGILCSAHVNEVTFFILAEVVLFTSSWYGDQSILLPCPIVHRQWVLRFPPNLQGQTKLPLACWNAVIQGSSHSPMTPSLSHSHLEPGTALFLTATMAGAGKPGNSQSS